MQGIVRKSLVVAALTLPGSVVRGAAGPVPETKLIEVRRLLLPPALADACNVRFDGLEALVFTARGLGAARCSYVGGVLGPPQTLLPEGSAGVVLAEHLGLSPDFVVASSPMSQLLWRSRKDASVGGQLGTWGDPDHAPIGFFEDIDLKGDQLAILGLMRAKTGMSPDGAIAWIGRLGSPDPKRVMLRPITFSTAGKGATPSNNCAISLVGKVRFLADGRLLVLPGAEPGIFLYSPDGKLQETWDTKALGLDLKCDYDEPTRLRLAADVDAHMAYLNQFTTVDAVLPLAEGPGLLVRSALSSDTHWKMIILGPGGKARSTIAMPLSAPTRNGHLRGDVLDGRILLIQREFLPVGAHKGELIEYRLQHDGDPAVAKVSGKLAH